MENLLIFQFGNFIEDYTRLNSGGTENYHEQKMTVDVVAGFANEVRKVTIISVLSNIDLVEEKELAPNLYGLNVPLIDVYNKKTIWKLLDTIAPQKIIVRSPLPEVLSWAKRNNVLIFPLLADYFQKESFPSVAWIKQKKLISLLNSKVVPIVANHNYPAAKSLLEVNVPANRILAFDYDSRIESLETNADVKTLPLSRVKRIIYVGSISKDKGVSDLVEAFAIYNSKFEGAAELTLIGSGQIKEMQNLVKVLGIADKVHFTGRIPLEEVLKKFPKHDLSVIPTRHSYAEGMPGTLYQALQSRLPVILSDHAVFKAVLTDAEVTFFRASDANSLAKQLECLLNDEQFYQKRSKSTVSALDKLRVKNAWSEVITRFVRFNESDRNWFTDHSLQGEGFV